MGPAQVRTAVKAFLGANWTTPPVVYENEGFEQSSDGDGLLNPYVFVEVMGGLMEQRSIGAGTARSNLWDAQGQVWLHVFVATGSGADQAATWADAIADLFRGLELSPNIEFQDIHIAAGGGSADGTAWRLSVSVDWTQTA
jgi:hypothetical protein